MSEAVSLEQRRAATLDAGLNAEYALTAGHMDFLLERYFALLPAAAGEAAAGAPDGRGSE